MAGKTAPFDPVLEADFVATVSIRISHMRKLIAHFGIKKFTNAAAVAAAENRMLLRTKN